jgi:hypothetical protein
MLMQKQEKLELAELVASAVITALKQEGLIAGAVKPVNAKTAYQKTEQLLYKYNNFKKIVDDRMKEIEEIRKYGVPQTSGAMGERVQNGNLPHGIVLPEESVENAVHRIKASVETTVQAISLIDKGMATLKNDPYYDILEMRYFEGRTLEDIGVYYNCSAMNISKNKNRLVNELALRLFPDQVVGELIG